MATNSIVLGRRNRVATAICLALATVSLAGLHSVVKLRAAQARERAALDTAPSAILLNGSKPRFTFMASGPTAQLDAPRVRRLVLTFRDSCPSCRAAVPLWEAIIRRTKWNDTTALQLISIEGTQMLAKLKGNVQHEMQISETVVPQDDLRLFVRTTGITAVPRTIALDEDGRIRMWTTVPSAAVASQLVAFLESGVVQ